MDLTFLVNFSCLGRACLASFGVITGVDLCAVPLLTLLLICDNCKRRSRDPCFLDNNNGLWSSFLKAKCVPTVRLPSWPCADSSFFACLFRSAASAVSGAGFWSGPWPAFLSKSSCCQRYWALQMHTGLRLLGPLPEWFAFTLSPFSFCWAGDIWTMTQQQCSRSAFLSLEASESDLEAARMSSDT